MEKMEARGKRNRYLIIFDCIPGAASCAKERRIATAELGNRLGTENGNLSLNDMLAPALGGGRD